MRVRAKKRGLYRGTYLIPALDTLGNTLGDSGTRLGDSGTTLGDSGTTLGDHTWGPHLGGGGDQDQFFGGPNLWGTNFWGTKLLGDHIDSTYT